GRRQPRHRPFQAHDRGSARLSGSHPHPHPRYLQEEKMMQSRRTRRLSAVSSLAVAALALTSCALGSDLDNANDGGSDDGVKRLVLAQSSDFKSLDPQNLVETPGERIMRNVYSRLFIIDDDMNPQPDLVTEYNQSDDLTWTFQIRDDVTFQNGDPLTAEDVAFSLNRPSDDDALLEYT